MGFSIEFSGWYLFLEILTIVCYIGDVVLISINYRTLVQHGRNIPSVKGKPVVNQSNKDKDKIEIKVRNAQVDLFSSAVATIPFSLILQD
jgi:hypothetical protein